MKTRKQKVIFRIFCTIVSILLLASFFAVPVSAADTTEMFTLENELYNYGIGPGGNYDPNYKPYSSLKVMYDEVSFDSLNDYYSDDFEDPTSVVTLNYSMRFEFDLQDDYAFLSYFVNVLPGNLSISTNDTLFINKGSLSLSIDSDYLFFTKCRFVIRSDADEFSFSYGEAIAATPVFDINANSDTRTLDYPFLTFDIFQDVSNTSLCLCVEFLAESIYNYGNLTDFYISQFEVEYGVGKSPNYPIYPSAPGKDDVDGLGSAEHELIQSQQQGINAGLNVMGDTSTVLTDLNSSLQLGAFATQLSGILDKIVTIPGIDALVQVSLALGLFASLMALSASIISAADRKAGQAKREAQRENRKK